MSASVPRVAILGGTGFVGRNLQDTLKSSGMTVEVFSRRTGFDVLQPQAALAKLQAFKPTYVVNCAALAGSVNFVRTYAADVVDMNMRLLLEVFKIMQQLPDAILINPIASCAYPGEHEIYEEPRFWEGPIHPSVLSYGSTRRMMWVLSQCYAAQHKVRSSNLYVPSIYGPYEGTDPEKTHALNALVIKFIRATKQRLLSVEIWGTGKPVREWLYVKDCAEVIRRVIEAHQQQGWSPRWLDPVNIGQRRGNSVREIVDLIRESIGYKGDIVYNTTYEDGAMIKIMDNRLFQQTFPGFVFTPLDRGLAETIRYYQEIAE